MKKKLTGEVAASLDAERAKARAFRVASRDGMRTTTITLTEADHRALSHSAIDKGVTMTELVRGLVSDYLAKRAKGARR